MRAKLVRYPVYDEVAIPPGQRFASTLAADVSVSIVGVSVMCSLWSLLRGLVISSVLILLSTGAMDPRPWSRSPTAGER